MIEYRKSNDITFKKNYHYILSLFKDTYILNIHRIQYNDALKYHIDKQTTKEYINLSIGTNFPRQITFSIKSSSKNIEL